MARWLSDQEEISLLDLSVGTALFTLVQALVVETGDPHKSSAYSAATESNDA